MSLRNQVPKTLTSCSRIDPNLLYFLIPMKIKRASFDEEDFSLALADTEAYFTRSYWIEIISLLVHVKNKQVKKAVRDDVKSFTGVYFFI